MLLRSINKFDSEFAESALLLIHVLNFVYVQVRKVALERVDALEAVQRQVYGKNLRLKSAQEALRNHREDLARKTEYVVPATQTLQIGFKASADALRRLQVTDLILQSKLRPLSRQAVGFSHLNIVLYCLYTGTFIFYFLFWFACCL